ncbi:hypothetical protein H4219_005135 [Mycoemilia scoparia]|uniref:Uncharacterized protein n=1 Tax=Mycoemilia scoparia TaxID=417184 RepID=A0A9W8DLN2_9FUNG|nr:hypothetical protein H4219_005135 [Mycoemilia scoparia]
MAESLGIVLSKPAHEESIPSDGNIQMVDISFKITCTIRSESVSFFSFRVLNEFTKEGTIFSGANVDSNSGEILTDEEAEEIVNSEGSYQTEEPNNALSEIDQESCVVEIPEQCNDASIVACGSGADEGTDIPAVDRDDCIKPQVDPGSSSSASAAPPPLENLEYDAILRKEIPMHEFFGSVAAEVEKISRS